MARYPDDLLFRARQNGFCHVAGVSVVWSWLHHPLKQALIPTNLAIKVPVDCYGRVAPRSGLAWKHSIDVLAGVIDADYRGDVGVILFNHGDKDFPVAVGDRVAQLILERIARLPVVEVADLDATDRGAGGFGSTGVSAGDAGASTSAADAANKVAKLAATDDVKSAK